MNEAFFDEHVSSCTEYSVVEINESNRKLCKYCQLQVENKEEHELNC